MNMRNDRPSQIEKVIKERSKRKWWQRAVSILSAVAVFCTTYAMILPAITWERSLICEIPEHRHNESCYEMKIVPGEKELVCLETEHEHGPECYIVTDNLICGLEECEGHTHGEGCFDEAGVLTCTHEESEGHSHSEACYEKELNCQIPEHVHSDSCWAEGESHEEKVLVCQLEEHEHSAACFDAPPAEDDGYYCGQIEHTHSDEQYCYFSDGSLWCTIPEHVHTLACKSDPNADVESEAKWCSTFANVSLTGNWAEDAIAIAKTQLGYTESTRNYEVQEDGTTIKGYTRYGDWYGNAYGDWCAMFCSFCLHYAGVDRNLMPLASGCEAWVSSLTEKELYHELDSGYVPKAGDLVFINSDEDADADHVGFVFEVYEDRLTTIEGNWNDCVCTVDRRFVDNQVLGYGEIPVHHSLMLQDHINIEAVNFTSARPILMAKSPAPSNVDGLNLSKKAVYNNDGTYTLTLETYTTGQVKSETTTVPLDIVLVLDTSGSMEEGFGGTTKMAALQGAVNGFIDEINNVYSSEADHRMAIIKFSNGAAIIQGWTFVDASGKSTLQGKINSLYPDGATDTCVGMQMAETLMGNSYGYGGNNTERQKVVILFTDGLPTNVTYGGDYFDVDNANESIASANRMKNTGVTVYSIGIQDGANVEQYDLTLNSSIYLGNDYGNPSDESIPVCNRFLNYLSSNFTGVGYMGGDSEVETGGWFSPDYYYFIPRYNYPRSNTGYYLAANNASALNAIFQSISSEISIPAIKLGQDAQVYDTVTDSFEIPESATVSLYTADCIGEDAEGKFTFGNKVPFTAGNYSISSNNKVTVTGFDFDNNICAKKPDGTYVGKKLIVEFNVTPKPGVTFEVGDNIPTNGDDSGVYSKDNDEEYQLVDVYEIPEVPPTKINIKYVDETETEIKESESVYVLPTVSYTAEAPEISEYELDESDTELDDNNRKTITASTEEADIIFHYKKSAVKLSITKSVVGTDTTDSFSFIASVVDGSFAESNGYTINLDGSVNFSLTDGDSIELMVSPSATVSIRETTTDGFYVKFTDASTAYTHNGPSDSFEMTGDRSITVVNTAGAELPSTGGIGVYPIYALGVLLVAGSVMYGCILRRKRERRGE